MGLLHADYQGLLKAIYELHECRELGEFRRAAPSILLKLIPGDYFLLSDYALNPVTRSATVVDFFESDPRWTPEAREFGARHAFAHPATQYFMQGGEPTAFMQSDFFTHTQFLKSDWAKGLQHYTDIDRMISLPVTSGQGNATVINIGRRRRNFNEHHRLTLNLLRPHYDQACRTLQFIESLRGQPPHPRLTPREAEVAHWLAQGKSNPEIGMILRVSPRTVDKHMERILQKLGVENRTTAAVLLSKSNGHPIPRNGGSLSHSSPSRGVSTGP